MARPFITQTFESYRTYLYDMMEKVKDNDELDEETKIELVEEVLNSITRMDCLLEIEINHFSLHLGHVHPFEGHE